MKEPRAKGRRVVVTGGASGIGLATAARFAADGARVAVLDRDEAGLGQLSESDVGVAATVRCDVSDPDDVVAAFEAVDAALGGIDVLVANAGISIRHPFLDITPADWHRVLAVNLDGVFFCAQQAARRMVAAGSGVILMTASTNGVVGHPFYADYNASKAGVLLLMRSMALELAPLVRVNAVCPGYVLTPMQQAEYTPAMLDATNAKIPLGRHARPDEVASLFAFLASDEGAYLTGAAVPIDGGELAGGLASRDWDRPTGSDAPGEPA
ncbi:MAG TPA: SDR family oxidoreductase [Candidatus Limnocylindrales bacterium]|nr:SDR family oxidoreductase [Candidatus Limnocylindrales bacterium]